MRRLGEMTAPLTARSYLAGAAAAALAIVAIGLPTAVLPNRFFMRMTPTRPQDYLFLGLTAILVGVIVATYVVPADPGAPAAPGGEGRLTAGGVLSFLAVGCPICNKLAVLALGVGGALRYFAPVQPLLGLASLALLGATAWARLRALRAGCALTPPPAPPLAGEGSRTG